MVRNAMNILNAKEIIAEKKGIDPFWYEKSCELVDRAIATINPSGVTRDALIEFFSGADEKLCVELGYDYDAAPKQFSSVLAVIRAHLNKE